ncbi:MAG: deoxyribose-phosphate aldolase [Salegentibacter sp.]|uniref:Deoxyribose-phosphate aldolase n=1 Tax=Salegentibacter flavus TaxID=287099 RepID=A0A1I5CKW3_9FLAO|nr:MULTISPECIES: deoxyribose-phosphate aldolase [Salegentibacter]MDR9457985.1 deoxyribose-phosphate aldolase [Salegentibacter sp.]SFN87544.1 deoxyribose-phosphate aldolase [Salegentibacter flavus]
MELNQYIDHTLLKPTATPSEIKKLCTEAVQHKFYAVCVNGCYVETAKKAVQNSDVKVAAVIGFPLGASTTASKAFEAEDCIKNGADEIDMVINIGMLKSGNLKYVEEEIAAIKNAIGEKILKVIIETCFLTDEEKTLACRAALNAKADFVKTSTGFGHGGATPEDIEIMKDVVGDKLQIKASGGIKDSKTAKRYIKLGVSRLGTSSGIALIS